MGVVVVVLLAALWASILIPTALRAHRTSSPIRSVDRFTRSMGMLAASDASVSRRSATSLPPGRHVMVVDPARPPGAARTPPHIVRRRRAVLGGLATAVLLTGFGAAVAGGAFTALLVVGLVALVGYVGGLVRVQTRRLEARRKVRMLSADALHGAPAAAQAGGSRGRSGARAGAGEHPELLGDVVGGGQLSTSGRP